MKRIAVLIVSLFVITTAFSQEAPEGLFINSKAPDFKAKDQNGESIRLKDLLKKGKVVLVFYRGYWCPYCSKQLQQLSDSLQLIIDKGATLLAISPQKPESITKTVEKTRATYSVLYDEELKIMKAYEVEYQMPENTLKRYKNGGIDIEEVNGKNGAYLPVPAVYIIDKDSNISYRFFNTDYKKRPSVKEIVANL